MWKVLLCLIILQPTGAYAQRTNMRVNLKGGGMSLIPIQDMKITIKFGPDDVENEDAVRNVMKSFKLLQNYPNPFNPATTIEYNIPKAGIVDVRLYDINGRLIRTLLNEHQEFGTHSLRWDSRNEVGRVVSNGVYFCKIRFDQVVLSKKMLLLK